MKTARLWLAFLAASRLSLYFWVMCGIIMLTSVSTVWWKEAEKRWFLDSCRTQRALCYWIIQPNLKESVTFFIFFIMKEKCASTVTSSVRQQRLNTGMWLFMGYKQMQPIKLQSRAGQTVDTSYLDRGTAAVHKTWHVVTAVKSVSC